jgi:type IV pilus assembly protein PilX
MLKSSPIHRPRPVRASQQRGVVMIITLIALAILMAGGIALVRSSDTTSQLAGQLAFRRDLKNQGERGLSQALALLSTGTLSTSTARKDDLDSSNYSAIRLASNAQGVPTVLTDNTAFTNAGMSAADLTDTSAGVTVRTVIDRLCMATGTPSDSQCTRLPLDCSSKGGQDSASMGGQTLKCTGTAYRISVRVDGPRSTQAFLQSIIAL